AALKLSHQVQVERMVAGANVEPNNLLGITEAISKLAPPTPPQTITIKIVPPTDVAPPDAAAVDGLLECRRCHWKPNGGDGVPQCYRCGWRHGMDMHTPWANPLNPEPKVIEGEVAKLRAKNRRR